MLVIDCADNRMTIPELANRPEPVVIPILSVGAFMVAIDLGNGPENRAEEPSWKCLRTGGTPATLCGR